MNNPAPLRKLLLTIGCVCLVVGLLPWWSTAKPDTKLERSIFSIGVPIDPWCRFVKEREEKPDGTVTFTTLHEYQVGLLSAFPTLAGVVLLVIGLRKQPIPTTS